VTVNNVNVESQVTVDNSQETVVPGTQLPPLPSLPPFPSRQNNDGSDGCSKSGESDGKDDVSAEEGEGLVTGFFDDDEYTSGAYAAADFPISQRIMHFLRGRKIDNVTRQNVEICLLIEAGGSVSSERTTTASVRNVMMMERYATLLSAFSPEDFDSGRLRGHMNQFLYNAKREMTGERLWKKFEDWRKILRTQYFSKLPKNLSDIPSGHQLMDVYKKFVVDRFREENVG
jgi:hypothetical protein